MSTAATQTATPHLNFIQHYILGTSSNQWIINGIVSIGIAFLLLVLIVWPFIVVPVLDYLDFRRLVHQKIVLLELTPPSTTAKTAHATDQLFTVLHGLYSIRSFKQRLLHQKQTVTFEAVSTREGGIRFIARVPEDGVAAFQQTVASYLPGIQFKQTEDYLAGFSAVGAWSNLLEFKQARHFAFPLKTHDALGQHDPMAFITGSLAKPEPGELLVVQVVLSPASSKSAQRVRNKLMVGKEPGVFEMSWKLPFILLLKLVGVAMVIIGGIAGTVGEIFTPSYEVRGSRGRDTGRPATKALQEIDNKMVHKLGQPLFRVNIRAFMVMNEPERLNQRAVGLIGSLASFHDPGFQGLITRRSLLLSRIRKYREFRLFKFANRLPAAMAVNSCLLSALC